MFKAKIKDKICAGTGIYEGFGCGSPCSTEFNGLCQKCLNAKRQEDTFEFAKVDISAIEDLKKIIKQIKNGYTKIAYKLYIHELKLSAKEAEDAGTDKVRFEGFVRDEKLCNSYKGKVSRALNYKVNPRGTPHTAIVFTLVFRQVGKNRLQKTQHQNSINKIFNRPKTEDSAVNRTFSVLDKMSDELRKPAV